MPVSLATGLEAAMSKTRRSERLFESIGSQGEQLEPKWHSHFGNYIVNTLLALHKFQAKKQISSAQVKQLWPASLISTTNGYTWCMTIMTQPYQCAGSFPLHAALCKY